MINLRSLVLQAEESLAKEILCGQGGAIHISTFTGNTKLCLSLSCNAKTPVNIETRKEAYGGIFEAITVVCLDAWPLNRIEAGVDLVLILTPLPNNRTKIVFLLTSSSSSHDRNR